MEYYFAETSGNAGGSDSGWQDSPTYTDIGLIPGTPYTYTVMARDKSLFQNTTTVSAPATVTTNGVQPSNYAWSGGKSFEADTNADGVNIIIDDSDDPVEVHIRRSLTQEGRFFARLNVTMPSP